MISVEEVRRGRIVQRLGSFSFGSLPFKRSRSSFQAFPFTRFEASGSKGSEVLLPPPGRREETLERTCSSGDTNERLLSQPTSMAAEKDRRTLFVPYKMPVHHYDNMERDFGAIGRVEEVSRKVRTIEMWEPNSLWPKKRIDKQWQS